MKHFLEDLIGALCIMLLLFLLLILAHGFGLR